jgi:hypothetical protein
MYKFLNFFNKKGEYCNFAYDETNDKWTGRVDFGTVSEGIIEDFQLYVMEEVLNKNTDQYEFSYPLIVSSYLPGPTSPVGPTGATSSSVQVNAYYNPATPVEEIFLYGFELGPTSNILTRSYDISYDFNFDPLLTIAGPTATKPGIKETFASNEVAMQINIGFNPTIEDGYGSTLYIKDIAGHVFAEIFIYGEGEEEDERLRDLLQSLGHDLLPSDSIIFDTSDVNEPEVDWILMNQKRKEMLLEAGNIFPYLGSYKALINIIKFFGYQNLRMKEYWLNIDQTSLYYGKYKQINIADVFTEDANFNNSGLVPNKIYKKTNQFGLFYDITVDSGEFDNDGLPIATEVFTFSPHEILIKIYALKKKLQNYFLPVNAKIVDIIGEAVYYGKYDINVWNDQYRIDSVSLGLTPKFSVLPSREGYLEDLRVLNFFGCPVGPDLTMGGYTNILSWRIGLATTPVDCTGPLLDTVQTFRLTANIPTGPTSITIDTVIKRDPDTGQDIFQPYEVIDKMITSWRANSELNSNFTVYKEGATSNIMRIVQTTAIGDGTVYADWFSDTNPGPATIQYSIPGPAGGTSPSINVSSGPSGTFGASGAPINYYGDCFMGYFDRINVPVKNLNDDEDIPVGYPIVLRNDTFNITWDDADVTYNQIDQLNINTNGLLYAPFSVSQIITGWGSTSTPIYAPVAGFPYTQPPFPSQNTYTWENIGYYGYYEMKWVVSKVEDTTPAFYYDSGVKPIKDLNSLPLILPYVGKYKIELYLWDGYNTRSFLINEDWIEVKIQDSDFIGWYQFRELDYTFDTKRYPVQSDYAEPPQTTAVPPGPNLTWDEYASTWDLPLHPNEEIGMADMSYNSLDSIEFYQNIYNPSTNPLIDRFPYFWNLITPLPRWKDLYHLWWDGTGTRITQWEIRGVTGPTIDLFMSRGNTVVDLNSGLNVYYVDGPTGYTGATGATSLVGTTSGEIIVSNANRRTYQWNGTSWNYIIDIIDSYRATGIIGSTKDKFLELTRQLNEVLPLDGFEHPFFNDFIYYYNEEYDATYSLNPYIRAASKTFQKGSRHKILMAGATGDNKSYETVYFGYLGDIPTHFEIYQVPSAGPSGTILLPGMTSAYSIGATNLTNLCNELNGPTAQSYNGISDYQFNLVLGYSGWTGPSGPSGGASEVKVQGYTKRFVSPQEVNVVYGNGVIGTTYGRSIIKNPTWDQIRVLKYSQALPLLTTVNFTYDPSKVHGKKNAIWKLTKEGDLDFTDIYYNNRYFSYMFTERGSYTLSLTLEDTNGNKQTVTKNELIKII